MNGHLEREQPDLSGIYQPWSLTTKWDDLPSTNRVQTTVGNEECDYSEDAVAASVVL